MGPNGFDCLISYWRQAVSEGGSLKLTFNFLSANEEFAQVSAVA
jgi:hypothetical protein